MPTPSNARGGARCTEVDDHDSSSRVSNCRLLLGSRSDWLTICCSVDPVILEHVELASAQQDVTPSTPVTPHSVSTWQLQTPLSPTYSTFSRDSRASFSSLSLRSARRTSSSPREMTGFSIPPPPKTAPGVLTLGQVLDGEKAADGPMAVEVVVTVDQE